MLASHLSITVTFQPNLVAVIMIGKILGGVSAILIAKWIAVPAAMRFEARDRELGIIGPDEYLNDEMTAEEVEELTKS